MRGKIILILFIFLFPLTVYAEDNVLNLYAWGGEIPEFIIRQFEKESGVKVNVSSYESNEIMYAKLRTAANAGYDIVMPSGYFVSRMRDHGMLEQLDKSKLTNWKHVNPTFLHAAYDPTSTYSIPYLWGITGIYVNEQNYSPSTVQHWQDLWDARFVNQLMLIDDMREVFAMAMFSLGYPLNDENPTHIEKAYLKLKTLMKNVKVFASDTLISTMIDEDANVGMAWNGDAYKASRENQHIRFIAPKEGFVIWVDNFVLLKSAPHKEAAYKFFNFIMQPEIAKDIALYSHYPTANLTAQKLLPPAIKNNPIAYPPQEALKHGKFQTDLSPATLAIYEKYWDELKMGG